MLVPLCLILWLIQWHSFLFNCNLLVQIRLGPTNNTVYQECSLPVFWDQYLLKELGRLVCDFYSRCLQQQQEQLQTPIQPDPVADLLRYLSAHCGQDPGLLDELECLSNGPAGLLHISSVFDDFSVLMAERSAGREPSNTAWTSVLIPGDTALGPELVLRLCSR